jgi:UDP-N-acetylglucosamine:LPS N-acetylglucosamine transferase
LENVGAARIILEKDLSREVLTNEINELISNSAELQAMGTNAHQIAEKNALENIKKAINGLTK